MYILKRPLLSFSILIVKSKSKKKIYIFYLKNLDIECYFLNAMERQIRTVGVARHSKNEIFQKCSFKTNLILT